MVVLDAAKQREIMERPHVELERRHARPLAVIDTFTVLTVSLAARLPIAFERELRAAGMGNELRTAESGEAQTHAQSDGSDQSSCRSPPRHQLPPAAPGARTWPFQLQTRKPVRTVVFTQWKWR